MTDEIARLRELLAKATPGPWGMYNGYGPCEDGLTRCASIGRMEGHRETVMVSPFDSADLAAKHEDFELIASAVNALPALLDRLEAAERRAGELEIVVRSVARCRMVEPNFNTNMAEIEFDAGEELNQALAYAAAALRGEEGPDE
jgi:hypothetical protein